MARRVAQVAEVVAVVPEHCRQYQQRFLEPAGHRRGRVCQRQIAELLPFAMRVTAYQLSVQRCRACENRIRAGLPPRLPRRQFGLRLTAVIAGLGGRYRLS
jgi:hypothetical protein